MTDVTTQDVDETVDHSLSVFKVRAINNLSEVTQMNGLALSTADGSQGIILCGELLAVAMGETGSITEIRKYLARLYEHSSFRTGKDLAITADAALPRKIQELPAASDAGMTWVKTLTDAYGYPNNFVSGYGQWGTRPRMASADGTFDRREPAPVFSLSDYPPTSGPTRPDLSPVTIRGVPEFNQFPSDFGGKAEGWSSPPLFIGWFPVFLDTTYEEILESPYALVDDAPSIAKSGVREKIDEGYAELKEQLLANKPRHYPYFLIPYINFGGKSGFNPVQAVPYPTVAVDSVTFTGGVSFPTVRVAKADPVTGVWDSKATVEDWNACFQKFGIGDIEYKDLLGPYVAAGITGSSTLFKTPGELFAQELVRSRYNAGSALNSAPVIPEPTEETGSDVLFVSAYDGMTSAAAKITPSDFQLTSVYNVVTLHMLMTGAADPKSSLADAKARASTPIELTAPNRYSSVFELSSPILKEII